MRIGAPKRAVSEGCWLKSRNIAHALHKTDVGNSEHHARYRQPAGHVQNITHSVIQEQYLAWICSELRAHEQAVWLEVRNFAHGVRIR